MRDQRVSEMGPTRRAARWRGVFVLALVCSAMVTVGLGSSPASGAVTAVSGSAFGYTTTVSLGGGPPTVRGFGQTIPPGDAASESPSVELPPDGSANPITATDTDGARGTYGPATFFGGRWPENVASAPPSGPITTSTQGTPAGGSVTSSVDIVLNPTPITVPCATGSTPPCTSPGGFGPGPPADGDELHATCTATEAGVTGSATFVNGLLTLSTPGGEPGITEPIPNSPPANFTRDGTLDHIGDSFTVVLNEQIPEADGSLTVNAVHLFAIGPFAIGEMIMGHVNCGVTASGGTTTTTGGGGTTTTNASTTTSSSSSTSSSSTSSTSSTTTTTGGNTTTTRNSSTGTTTAPSGTGGSGTLEKNLGQLARTGTELRWLFVLGFVALVLGWLFTLGARAREGDYYG